MKATEIESSQNYHLYFILAYLSISGESIHRISAEARRELPLPESALCSGHAAGLRTALCLGLLLPQGEYLLSRSVPEIVDLLSNSRIGPYNRHSADLAYHST